MQTPDGKECKYFFGDYFRGKNREECRLLSVDQSHLWNSGLCKSCLIPRILLSNACPEMILTINIKPSFLSFGKKLEINAHCKKTEKEVDEPFIGCGQCHPLPTIFTNL